jgi:hypothetical protein
MNWILAAVALFLTLGAAFVMFVRSMSDFHSDIGFYIFPVLIVGLAVTALFATGGIRLF